MLTTFALGFSENAQTIFTNTPDSVYGPDSSRISPSYSFAHLKPLALSLFLALAPAAAFALDTQISGGSYAADLYGNTGSTTPPVDASNASNNTLTLGTGSTGPTFTGDRRIYGGSTNGTSGDANGNTLTVNGGTSFDGSYNFFYGGQADATSGSASNNVVAVQDGVTQSAVGGVFHLYGGQAGGMTSGNTVTVSNGNATFTSIYGGDSGTGDALSNAVTLGASYTGTVNSSVYGGSSISGSADRNSVKLASGTVLDGIIGGNSHGANQTASLNIVTVTGGSVWGVAGGQALGTGGMANGNSVEITGGSIIGDGIVGGAGFGGATNNTVTLGGSPTLAATAILAGGFDPTASGTGDYFTGNTLVKNSGVTIAASGTTANTFGAQNFETVRFGYSGDANIGSLDTTVRGGAPGSLVKLDTQG
ncbi:MAG: hypothetical protein LBG78_05610, partial [Azoarcus sp.]|nr:hypothetical protein [Azoarcus sp.]